MRGVAYESIFQQVKDSIKGTGLLRIGLVISTPPSLTCPFIPMILSV